LATSLRKVIGTVYQRRVEPTPGNPIVLFEHLFGDGGGWLVTFTGRQARLEYEDARPNELCDLAQWFFQYPRYAHSAADYLLNESEAGRDTYFGVHLYRTYENRRRTNAMPMVSALWLDEDGGCYPDYLPEPTATVWSSADRRHRYWQLAQQVSVEWACSMNRRIAEAAGGDTGKAGLSSVLRPPGTLNYKRYPQIDPVTLELHDVAPHHPAIFDDVLPPEPDPDPTPTRRHYSVTYSGPDIGILEFLVAAGVEIRNPEPDSLGEKFSIICPWAQQHTGGDKTGTFAGKRHDGGMWFHCHHAHCTGRGWREFRRAVLPFYNTFKVSLPGYTGNMEVKVSRG